MEKSYAGGEGGVQTVGALGRGVLRGNRKRTTPAAHGLIGANIEKHRRSRKKGGLALEQGNSQKTFRK